ncbi:kinectin [Ascaphus truei]|uniref:kinectin n=1 Tax=Ascaphus truei TaxID=8439 RepID=UPI003F592997
MEFYESTYFIVLVPSVVITAIFLFFWLFMKETSYDEILAKQKKDLKLPPAKMDKKKTDKKKNKKRDSQNGTLHESDSETAIRDFDLGDALAPDEEHVVPVPTTETFVSIRERKKKDKKKPAPEDHVSKEINGTKFAGKKAEAVPVTKQPTPPPPDASAGSKKKQGQKKQKNGQDDSPISPGKKTEQVVPSAKKQEALILPGEGKLHESGSGKKKVSVKKQQIDHVLPLVDEPLIQATHYIPLMDNTELKVVEKKDVVNLEKSELTDGFQKSGSKKMKILTDKENAEVKFKDFLLTVKNMALTEDEAMSVVELVNEKSNAVQVIIQKVSAFYRSGKSSRVRGSVFSHFGYEGNTRSPLIFFVCLFKELLSEKQKGNLVEAKAKERIATLEKDHGVFQNKMHGSYQEAQQMQLKFQQIREQLEGQVSHLKQENGILRDAVSSATNQMESKQSGELNKLRQDYARLVNELTEKNTKVAQEELQKKNSDQAMSQLTAQMQETERRSEEMEAYLRKRASEYEAAQQDMQAKLNAKEKEVQSLLSKLTDTMVSKQQLEQRIMQLMDAGQGETLHVQDLLKQNETLNVQMQKYNTQRAAQSSASVLVEELQKTIAEKDKQIQQTADSLAFEHANFASSGEELKALQRENGSLKAELQKFQALKNEQAVAAHALEQMQRSFIEKDEKIRALEERLQDELVAVSSKMEDYKALHNHNNELQLEVQKLQAQVLDQANNDLLGQMEKSIVEKDEKIKTVEELLEAGLIEVANKQEDVKLLREKNASLRKDMHSLQVQQREQISLTSIVEELQKVIHEKEGEIKSVGDLLQAERLRADSREKTVQALNREMEALKDELGNNQHEKAEQDSVIARVQELQNELKAKEEALKTMEVKFTDREKDIADKEGQIEDLGNESNVLKVHIEDLKQQYQLLQQQEAASSQVHDLHALLKQQEEQLRDVVTALSEKERGLANAAQELQDLRSENGILKVQACELQQKHDQQIQQASSAARGEELLKALAEKDGYMTDLQNELESVKSALEQQRKKNNDLREKNWKAMEALASTEKMLQERVNKTAKEKQQHVQAAETEARDVLQKLFPNVSVSANLRHGEWVQEFEKLAKVCLNERVEGENVKEMEQKLKDGEEIHNMLQLECDKYKSVLAETEGILQRLQRSVEEEEGRWKLKVEENRKELKEMQSTVHSLEQELERSRRNKEAENPPEREHLEMELEKTAVERATYASEVRELKTQLNDTLQKLDGQQSERQKVAGDLHEAQLSLDLIRLEILKAAGDSVIDNSGISSETEGPERKKMSANLIQTVTQLQQHLQAMNQQLTKGREHL